MNYRGYTIEPSFTPYAKYKFYKTDVGNMGDNVHLANSIESAKSDIDHIIFDGNVWEVEFEGLHYFAWLDQALDFVKRTGGILKTQFDSI